MTDKIVTVTMTPAEATIVADAMFSNIYDNLRKAGLQGNDMYDRAYMMYLPRTEMMLRILEEAGQYNKARDYRVALTSLRKEREYEQN